MMSQLRVVMNVVITIFTWTLISSLAHAGDAISLSETYLPNVCKVLPRHKLDEAGGTYPMLSCKWSPLDDSPAYAQVSTFDFKLKTFDFERQMASSRTVYDGLKATQEGWSHTYDDAPGMKLIEIPTVRDCTESRMIVWTKKGVPIDGLAVAHCADLAINFRTLGAVFTKDIEDTFPKIVRALVADRQKIKSK
jgi:hypothetical protein